MSATPPCDCCEPLAPLTPVAVENRPGLSAVAYRIGTYASFRASMLEQIASTPELALLTTRADDDYGVTLLDLWAAVADVLTFYQERYGNEGFLRTATRRESIVRLARLIGYHPRPGVAALASLAFTVEAGKSLDVAVGLRVQSVPGQDEQAQTFETLEQIVAHAALNRARVVPAPQPVNPLATGAVEALLMPGDAGLEAARALAPGDRILVYRTGSSGTVEELKVRELRFEDDRVTLAWSGPAQGGWTSSSGAVKAGRTFRLFGQGAPASAMRPVSTATVPGGLRWNLETTSFRHPATAAATTSLPLDGRIEGIATGTRLVVDDAGGSTTLVTVTDVGSAAQSLGGLTDTVTVLTVAPAVPAMGDRRRVTVHELAGGPIPFWRYDYAERVTGASVYLSGRRTGDGGIEIGRVAERARYRPGEHVTLEAVEPGRTVMVGDAATEPVLAGVESASITATLGGVVHLRLDLDLEEALDLDARSAFLLGNAAAASHGETVASETLGDGAASARFQRFALKKPPLTYVPSAKAGGVESSLSVSVNGVRWSETPALYGQDGKAQVYTARESDDGSTLVQFGDGQTGAPLPTGRGNVRARYRTGTGLAGRVRSGTLTSALDRPPGLKEVGNPLAATGGADAETVDATRENAPATVRTFGRAVSLRDFADLVRETGEVAKAQATWVWDGLDRAIHLTVAGQAGGLFTAADLARIGAALGSARDPNHTLRLDNYVPLPVLFRATIDVDPRYVQGDVVGAARTSVLAALSFDAVRLGSPLHLSDLYRVIHDVDGVVAADVDELQPKRVADRNRPNVDRLPNGTPAPLQPHVRVRPARPDPAHPGAVLAAELASVEDEARDVTLAGRGGIEA